MCFGSLGLVPLSMAEISAGATLVLPLPLSLGSARCCLMMKTLPENLKGARTHHTWLRLQGKVLGVGRAYSTRTRQQQPRVKALACRRIGIAPFSCQLASRPRAPLERISPVAMPRSSQGDRAKQAENKRKKRKQERSKQQKEEKKKRKEKVQDENKKEKDMKRWKTQAARADKAEKALATMREEKARAEEAVEEAQKAMAAAKAAMEAMETSTLRRCSACCGTQTDRIPQLPPLSWSPVAFR